MATPNLVIIGGPNSGKTHYAGQLYGRLRRRPGVLKLRPDATPGDLTTLEEVLGTIENGLAAEHTSADTWAEIQLPLVDETGRYIDLNWPDYGGEQTRAVTTDRTVPERWRQNIVDADGWLIMLRLKSETTYHDALREITERAGQTTSSTARSGSWDANARWVELLQILLHVAGRGLVEKLQKPQLTVLLSCYDELETKGLSPRDVLHQKLPLLASFIATNWHPEGVQIWGLSALGQPLDRTNRNDKFIDEGPEFQGWVVAPDGGEQDPDLTRPLAWML